MSSFKYDISEIVKVTVSGETGAVIGRAEYQNAEPQYLLRYQARDGRAVESWWTEDALQLVGVNAA